ncbi:putative catalase [Filobasidium floriforme]|uniref:putative catalase n=1 Tax=Filobasidium floriforme TaxID=5210 RepID=UPI001E8EBA3F|nr:putative catalase [Filobasidium floriforme]KAH8079934.1 putative catalase [Filobasidium floriforme]
MGDNTTTTPANVSAQSDGQSPCPANRSNFPQYESDRHAKSTECTYATSNGVPMPHPYEAQRIGNGPLLLQDFHLIDLISHFDRERIPERVVHAKGAGAHGIFECTDDLSDLCLADMFKKGRKTPLTTRFSTVGGESGSADAARDPRGFSVKFKTNEGNWDFVANNTPVFFLRDPAKFPHFIHTQKRDPATHLTGADDSTNFWDYLSNNPESIHQVMILFGDRGIPDGYRHMHGYYGHTLKLVNKAGEWIYAQFHLISDQGTKTLTAEKAATLSPDYSTKDLYEAIARKEYPSWTMKVQTMNEEQAQKLFKEKGVNVLDLTHTWSQKDFPLRTVGKMTLNENPENYFAEVEQAAYNPAHMVPGIEPSADPVLQSRLFSYPDAHRHRIGANYQQLPVNAPVCPMRWGNFQRDGQMAFYNQGARPNYLSSIDPIQFKPRSVRLDQVHNNFVGDAVTFLTEIREEDFNQPRDLWQRVFDDGAKERFINNISTHMSTCREQQILERQLSIFAMVDKNLADAIAGKLNIKSYPDAREVTFNGSHSALSKEKKPANGMDYELKGGNMNAGPAAPERDSKL